LPPMTPTLGDVARAARAAHAAAAKARIAVDDDTTTNSLESTPR